MNPWVVAWGAWIGAFFVIEGAALFASHRIGKGLARVDTFSRLTQWAVRAHQRNADVTHAVAAIVWLIFAVWFPWHIFG